MRLISTLPALAAALLVVAATTPTPTGGSVKYGLVFDAGSSGSRIHVYSWREGGGGAKAKFELIEDELYKIKPGLSAFKDSTDKAGDSLRPLLDFARARVPANMVGSTPVFLMATAGLRMVGEEKKEEILRDVVDELGSSGFMFRKEWANLLGGQDEGLYGWVTVNYMLEALYPPADNHPVGIIDLGGGSVQIVYETSSHVASSTERQTLNFGSRSHSLYVKSHLGFGLDEARKAVLASLLERRGWTGPVAHPCLPRGATQTYEGVELVGEGDWTRCSRLVGRLFKDGITKGQPPLADRFYGFSYMYDRTAAIGLFDSVPRQFGSVDTTIEAISAAGEPLCALDAAANTARFANTQDAAKSHNYCGDVAYVAELLRAFGFSEHTPITMTNKIKDVELVWTLGAMLAKSAMLAGEGGGMGTGIVVLLALLVVAVLAMCAFRASGRRRYSQVSGKL